MKEKIIVIASFLLIFAFASVDNAISPMVEPIHRSFGIPMDRVLWLISYCTIGIVIGVFVGPIFTASYRISRLALVGVAGLVVSLSLFLFTNNFYTALLFRVFFGLSAGLIASLMWWVTYYGVSKKYYQAMVIVLMSARPLAIALGVPAAGFTAVHYGWRMPFWMFGLLIIVSGLLFLSIVGKNDTGKTKLKLSSFLGDYKKTFSVPFAREYYLGFTINRMCYFGFYSLAGIWFIRHYSLGLEKISLMLLFIGLGETVVNFLVPKLLKIFGHKFLFTSSVVLSAFVFALFIGGWLPLWLATAMITLFVILDRIYCMTAVISIPKMFPTAENKTVFGSLNTLTAWSALTVISWFEGNFLDSLGLPAIEYILLGLFVVGSSLIYYVQHKTISIEQKATRLDAQTADA